jgi:predicted DNA-binding transcriptional regulator AlpA
MSNKLNDEARYLTGPQVCRRYSVSDMAIWRWLQNPELGFPRPAMVVNNRRFWLESDLVRWERQRAKLAQRAELETAS